MVTKVVVEDGATVVADREANSKRKGKEQMSTNTIVTDAEAVAKENAQLKNIIETMRAESVEQQASAQNLTPETIAGLMAAVSEAREIASKVASYNARIDEIKKDLEDTKAKLESLPEPVAVSSSGGPWDGTNWIAPALTGMGVTAVSGLGLWYFVFRD